MSFFSKNKVIFFLQNHFKFTLKVNSTLIKNCLQIILIQRLKNFMGFQENLEFQNSFSDLR